MTRLTDTCIYCLKQIDPARGDGDHVVPAAFGRFVGEFAFRRICRQCNSRIGTAEEQLLRSAPEAFFRRLVQAPVKRHRRGRAWVGTKAAPPPRFTIVHGDHSELVDASKDDPQNVEPVDQLVIVGPDRRERHVRLFPGMSAAALRAKVGVFEFTPAYQVRLYADAEAWPRYVQVISELWPGSTVVSEGTSDPGMRRVAGRTRFQFTEDYWRALAKIAFHYYLVHTRRGLRGDEEEFRDIRRFIVEGGDYRPFFEGSTKRFAMPFRVLPDGRALLSSVWAHILAADETEHLAVAAVHLFTGPQRLPPIHHVTLGRFCTPLVLPGARWSHAYLYDRTLTPAATYAGTVEPVSLTRIH